MLFIMWWGRWQWTIHEPGYLASNSMYRGKAFDGQEVPQFLDLSGVDASKVVYTAEVLDAAIAEAHVTNKPIELMVQNDDYFRTLSVPYFDGPRWPHLTPIPARADVLAAVLKARVR